MNAGDLNHVVRIDQRTQTQDPATGAITTTWSTFLDQVFAAVTPRSGKEMAQASVQTASGDTYIGFWFVPGITTSMRVTDLDSGTVYDINAVMPDNINGRTWVTLMCTSGLTDGR